jgi:carboxymethylenebutenolidase
MQATASLHGTMLISDKPDSPHLKAEWMRGEVFCGFAEKDRFCPPPLVARIEALFRELPVRYASTVHADADHGYALPLRDVHDAKATALDWTAIYGMFDRVLGGDPTFPL